MKRGLFVSFEGIDGCGKSTQMRMLGDYIWDLSKYNHVVRTRNPYKNTDIRAILAKDSDPYSKGLELAKMFVDDRKEHARDIVLPNLALGLFVLSDRYDLSTLAYQQTQGIPLDTLLDMHEGLVMPDLTYIIDVPVDVAIERMKKDQKRSIEQKFETNREFMEKLRQNYLKLSKQLFGRNLVIVDNIPSPDIVFNRYIRPAFDALHEQNL